MVFLSIAAVGCGPIEQARMRPYEVRELQCIQNYSNGDIQAARQSLLDYLHLIEEEEASGLPFKKTAYSKALVTARLTLICRELGETNLATQYFQETVRYARAEANGEDALLHANETDEQVGTSVLDRVTKLDEKNLHPKWRTK
jgi:hypothetical protein